jgi:hypothetical protein
MKRPMDADNPASILYMNQASMTANVDDQRGEGTIAPRQICGQKLYLMRTASPQSQRHGAPNLYLLLHALGRHQIPSAKRLD